MEVKEIEEFLSKNRVSVEDALKLKGLEKELEKKFESSDCKVRKKVVFAIGVLASNVELLRKALSDECPWVRGVAAEMLGKLGVKDEKIISLLNDSCPWVRHRAADALSYLCKDASFALKAYKQLIEKLNDPSPYVQNYVVHALRVCLSSFEKAGMKEKEEVESVLLSYSSF